MRIKHILIIRKFKKVNAFGTLKTLYEINISDSQFKNFLVAIHALGNEPFGYFIDILETS